MSYIHDPFIIKNLTFGIEDSLISTTGVLVGIAAAKFQRREILITGIILILVEALSMSYGAFLSDENFLKASQKKYTTEQITKYALTMFSAYMVVGILLLLPYGFNIPYASVFVVVIAMTLLTILVVFYEKDKKRIAMLVGIGGILMTISIVLGSLM